MGPFPSTSCLWYVLIKACPDKVYLCFFFCSALGRGSYMTDIPWMIPAMLTVYQLLCSDMQESALAEI